jgi:hypothetical protein
MATAPKPKLAPADPLKREIQSVLTDELRQMILRGGAVLIGTQMIGFLSVISTTLARGA